MNAKKATTAKKASRASVAVKRTKRTPKAEAAPAVKRIKRTISDVWLVLPEGHQTYDQTRDFILANMMPPFGKLTKTVDTRNTMFQNELAEYFAKHPDPEKSGTYVFAQNREGEQIYVHQIVPGYADAMLTLLTDTVRRGPKNVQFFSGAKDWGVLKQTLAIGMDVDQKRSEEVDRQMAQDAAVEGTTIPNVFHKPWPQVFEMLNRHITDKIIFDSLRDQVRVIASRVAAFNKSVDETVNALDCVVQTRVGLMPGENGAVRGSVEVQLFQAARAGAVPIATLRLGTERLGNDPDRIVSVTADVPLGSISAGAPDASQHEGARFVSMSEALGRDEAVLGARRGWAGGNVGWGGGSVSSDGRFSPYGRAPGLHGVRPSPSYPGGYPEKNIFTTNALPRFMTYVGMVIEDELAPVQRAAVEQVLMMLNTNFRNLHAGVMTFVMDYTPGKGLVIQVHNGYGEVIFAHPVFLS